MGLDRRMDWVASWRLPGGGDINQRPERQEALGVVGRRACHAEAAACAKTLGLGVEGELVSFKIWKGSQNGWSSERQRTARQTGLGRGKGKAPRVVHPHPG